MSRAYRTTVLSIPVIIRTLMVSLVMGCGLSRRPHGQTQDRTQPPITVSTIGEPSWTRTTWESASTPSHRKVLEHAQPKTVIGEVVDVSCFLQLGKHGEAHIPCGQRCIRNGQPIGLLTDAGHLYLVIPEEHHQRRDGQVNIKERFVELLGKRVQVSGMVTKYNDYRTLFVRTLPTEQ